MNLIKDIKQLGFEALGAGAAAVGLFVFGFQFFAGIALGVFLTRNFDAITALVQEKL